ncbi:MAG: 4Fe-4S binding protein [Sedimenticola sp.]
MLRTLLTKINHKIRQPDVVADRCVHSLVDGAECNACVSVCPKKAWILDDEALGFDTSLCDGCGLCVPACPQGAIEKTVELEIKQSDDRQTLLCACEPTQITEKDNLLPCIHSIGTQEILGLYSTGVREISVTTGDCNQCERGTAIRLKERLDLVNDALNYQGLDKIESRHLSRSGWLSQNKLLSCDVEGEQLSRRSFLGSLLTSGLESGVKRSRFTFSASTDFMPPGRLLPQSCSDTLWPYLPEIDQNLCSGCDVCAKACPHRAITLDSPEWATCYLIEPANCTGCGICHDLCDQDALSIHQWRIQNQHQLALATQRCHACGVVYHRPREKAVGDESKCHICSAHNHHSKLFQVLPT